MLFQFFCSDGQHSSTADLFFQTPEEGAKHLFHDPEGMLGISLINTPQQKFNFSYLIEVIHYIKLFIPTSLFRGMDSNPATAAIKVD